MRRSVFAVMACAFVMLAACEKEQAPKLKEQPPAPVVKEAPPPVAEKPAPAPTATAVAAAAPIPAESTKMFNERCALCHGKEGKGDGIGAKGMKPPPRNWTDAEWQKSVTDEHIATALVKGGAAIGKSPTMPPSPDLEGKTAVINGLVQIVRSFSGK